MRSKFIWASILSCLAAASLITWLYWSTAKNPAPQFAKSPPTSPAVSLQPSPHPSVGPSPLFRLRTAQETEAAHDAEVKQEQAIAKAWIMTPITFYGKVVDEKGNPVSGAAVAMSAADQPYGAGSKYERTSDDNGRFSVAGIHGLGLLVIVSKSGYYSLPQSRGNFGYAMQGGDLTRPHPDESAPAMFVLRKMGETEPLIVQNRNVKISKTGAPVSMDLRTGNTFGAHSPDIEVQAWTQNQGVTPGTYKHYDWRCVITVPGGGLRARTGGDFDFQAPADGYQPSDEIDMASTANPWSSRVSREYFVELANGEYARMSFSMYAGGDHFFSVTSYLNPTPGQRNLEYNPDQQPSAP